MSLDDDLYEVLHRPLLHPSSLKSRLDGFCRLFPGSKRSDLEEILRAVVREAPRAKQEHKPSFLYRFLKDYAGRLDLWKENDDGSVRHVADSTFISAYVELGLIGWMDALSGKMLDRAREIVKSPAHNGVTNLWFVDNVGKRNKAAQAIRVYYGQRQRNLPRLRRVIDAHRVKPK